MEAMSPEDATLGLRLRTAAAEAAAEQAQLLLCILQEDRNWLRSQLTRITSLLERAEQRRLQVEPPLFLRSTHVARSRSLDPGGSGLLGSPAGRSLPGPGRPAFAELHLRPVLPTAEERPAAGQGARPAAPRPGAQAAGGGGGPEVEEAPGRRGSEPPAPVPVGRAGGGPSAMQPGAARCSSGRDGAALSRGSRESEGSSSRSGSPVSSRESEESPPLGSNSEGEGGRRRASTRRILAGRMRASPIQSLESLDCMLAETLMEAGGLIMGPRGQREGPGKAPRSSGRGSSAARVAVAELAGQEAPRRRIWEEQGPGAGEAELGPEELPEMLLSRGSRSFCSSRAAGLATADMDALRAAHDKLLMAEMQQCSGAPPAGAGAAQEAGCLLSACARCRASPLLLLGAFGVVPFGRGRLSWLYGWAVCAGMAAMLVYSAALVAMEPNLQYFHLTTTCVALGALSGLAFLWARRIQDLLGPRNAPLAVYADACGFTLMWNARSMQRLVVVAVLWATTVVCRTVAATRTECPATSALPVHLCMFSAAHALMASLVYCQLHICCGFELSIDSFCFRFFRGGNFTRAIAEWNILQAMLRRSAHDIQACFLALSTSVLALLLLTGLKVWSMDQLSSLSDPLGWHCQSLWAGWVLPPVALIFSAVFQAAVITEKCARVPSLVNSWVPNEDEQADHHRQYVVQYIRHSAAGFYIKGVRVRATSAFQMSYLLAAVLFSLISLKYKDFFGPS